MLRHIVIKNEVLNDKFNLLTLKSNNKLDFEIGQFVLINIGKSIKRAYSIASTPEELPFWKILVDITPGGPGTTYLKNLKKGDIIQTTNPNGQFILSLKSNYYIFGATGCGIAPFLPMIDVLIRNKKKVCLYWGLRHEDEITLKDTLSKWEKTKKFSFEIILSQPKRNWAGKVGHISPYVLNKAKSLNTKELKIYLSGSKEFIKESSKLFKENKIHTNKIHFEACY